MMLWMRRPFTAKQCNNFHFQPHSAMHKISFLSCILLIVVFGSCTMNKAKINNDLKKYFDSANVDGSFALLNNQMGDVTVYNMKLDTLRMTPATSFNVFAALVGIQTGKITNESMVMSSDSAQKGLTLKEAIANASMPYFQEITKEIGKDTLKFWIDTVSYGNKKVEGTVDSFWLNGSLRISPDEQLGLMSKLYFDQLPFQKYAQQMVRDAMLREDNTQYKLSYATGTGTDADARHIGWVVGWIEENLHVYFFVTVVKTPQNTTDPAVTGTQISKAILKEMGFFKGEK